MSFSRKLISALTLFAIIAVVWKINGVETGSDSERNLIMNPYIMSRHPDPFNIMWTGDWVVTNHLWIGLVQYDHSGQIAGQLADRWTQSLDGQVWTFALHPGLRWSDGSPMTADQVVQSLRASRLGTSHTSLARAIDSIESDGDHVIFRLNRRVPSLLVSLSYVDWAVVHPDSIKIEGGRARVHRVSSVSGPYSLADFEGADSTTAGAVILQRNIYDTIKGREGVPLPKVAEIRSFSDCEQLSEFSDRILTFRAYGPMLTEKCRTDLETKGFNISPAGSSWIHKLEITTRGRKRIPLKTRQALIVAIQRSLRGHESEIGFGPATGIRPTDALGGLPIERFSEVISVMASETNSIELSGLHLDLVTMKEWSPWPSYLWVKRWLLDQGIQIREVVLAKNEYAKGMGDQTIDRDFDFNFIPLGAADIDPDSTWRIYKSQYRVEGVSNRDLDLAYFESDFPRRLQLYEEYAKRILISATFIPLVSSADWIGFHKSIRKSTAPKHQMGLTIFDMIR